MKRFAAGMALLGSLALTSFALAQFYPGSEQGRREWGGQRQGGRENTMGNAGAQLDRLAQQLKLTDQQKEKVKPILENQAKQFENLRQDSSLSQADTRARFQEIRQDTFKQIRPILNSDQQKQLDEMIKNAGERQRGGWRHERSNPQ